MSKELKQKVKEYQNQVDAYNDPRRNEICLTIRLDAESPSDNVSVTNVMERLDIETLLQRAQAGILDLRAYQRPMGADVVGAGRSLEQIEAATLDLLNVPDSPTNRVFGTDKETANKALKDLQSLADRHRVPKKEEPVPGKDDEHREENEPQKGDS